MTCKQTQTRLADYSAQRLPSRDADEIRVHLDRCGECARLLRSESLLTGELERMHRVEPRADLWRAVAAGLDAPAPRSRLSILRDSLQGWRTAVASVAVGTALATGVFVYTSQIQPTADPVPVSISAPHASVSEVNREVDDPLAPQMEGLSHAVDAVAGAD